MGDGYFPKVTKAIIAGVCAVYSYEVRTLVPNQMNCDAIDLLLPIGQAYLIFRIGLQCWNLNRQAIESTVWIAWITTGTIWAHLVLRRMI